MERWWRKEGRERTGRLEREMRREKRREEGGSGRGRDKM